jgi:hypothetical protein
MADMLDLYHECKRRGLNVHALAGFTTWQEDYWFRREGEWSGRGSRSNPPNCFINHHTATPEVSGYMPNVKNSKGQSKAHIWTGIQRSPSSARLYQSGSGVAAAYFAVRWAGNYTNGACDRTVYEYYVWRDRIAPNQPSGGDDGYANKHGIGMEIIHEGTGDLMDPGVFELAAQINAAAMHVFGWSIARILDHRSSTRRKQDLNQAQKLKGYTINALRARILEIVAGDPPIDPPEPEDPMSLYSMYEGDGIGDKSGKASDVINFQLKLQALGHSLTPDAKYGPITSAAVKAFCLRVGTNVVNNGKQLTGRIGFLLEGEFAALRGSGGGDDHAQLEAEVAALKAAIPNLALKTHGHTATTVVR